MRVILFGRNAEEMHASVTEAGFDVVERDADFVISYGGDGTLMHAEYIHPGIPKILLKDSYICKKCSIYPNRDVLEKILRKEFRIETLMNLEVRAGGKVLRGMNDVIIHNKDPRHAIRYAIAIDGRAHGNPIIGDGVVAATPFGSTAYYRSITDSFFELGIGVAFNNSTEQSDHMVLKEESVIAVTMIRGPAVVYADNQEEHIVAEEGAEIIIKKSDSVTSLVIPL
jgi:NAD+ kinase